MRKLSVKHVGPIKGGYESGDGYIDFPGVTMFIGPQGSGKSTIAKLYSTLAWIEKALFREDFSLDYLTKYNRFKKQLKYQNISNYLSENSEINYHGQAYDISYRGGELEIRKHAINGDYAFPKIMYVPAERNFVSAVDKPDLMKRLPAPLYTFLEEYDAAKRDLGGSIDLPIGNTRFAYREQNETSLLIGPSFRVSLLEASSGFQSFVPLYLVTNYLSKVTSRSTGGSHKEISVEEAKKIRREVDRIFDDENISEDVRRVLLEKLSSRFKYSCFLNIVEEPENNLYPSAQKDALFELIRTKNEVENNQLVITTHSPYMINYLTLAIKANAIKAQAERSNQTEILERLEKVVPRGATIGPERVAIYRTDEEGSIHTLPDYDGLPSDENDLNQHLIDSNNSFVDLLEMEDQCR